MRNLLNPIWLFLINTLPILVIFLIFYSQFEVIHTLLEPENIQLWKTTTILLGTLGILNFGYALTLVLIRKKVSIYYGGMALLSYISFLYYYTYHLEKLLPAQIPTWMMSDEVLTYMGIFLMPTLVYALFVLIIRLSTNVEEKRVYRDLISALCVPIAIYLFVVYILPFWEIKGDDISTHSIIVLTIVVTVIFLFFLLRALYVLVQTKKEIPVQFWTLLKIAIAFLFPLVGLLLNGSILNSFTNTNSVCIFGNFSSYWFFVLLLINALLICIPEFKHKGYRIFLFAGRCITFMYTLYFFLVFLPFLPVSLLAIIAVGIGFLLLAPLFLFVIHVNLLSSDYLYLKQYYPVTLLVSIGILCSCVLPALVTAVFLKEKRVLVETLNYISYPDYSKTYTLDKGALSNLFAALNTTHNSHSFFTNKTPLLSTYYTWLVLDNMTVSQEKKELIKRVFFNKEYDVSDWEMRTPQNSSRTINISDIKTHSDYNAEKQYWNSWMELEITKKGDQFLSREYSTTFHLPVGCSISDYYLYVGEVKEPGILAEKKAATWIYNQITRANLDPGILYYTQGNEVTFKVSPFLSEETRKTGIQFIHKDPVLIEIDGHSVLLGDTAQIQHLRASSVIEKSNYISASEKKSLPLIQRTPYFHFIADVSVGKNENAMMYAKQIKELLKNSGVPNSKGRISFVNSYVHTYPLDENWEKELLKQPFEGGFFLERAIRKALVAAYEEQTDQYPILVVLADSLGNAILDSGFSDLKMTYPESDFFYEYNSKNQLLTHALLNNPTRIIPNTSPFMPTHNVCVWETEKQQKSYLRVDNEASIVLQETDSEQVAAPLKKDWQAALFLQAEAIRLALHPELTPTTWQKLLKQSFESQLMTPLTSYIVVENAAQKALLKKKQEQVLDGHPGLDLSEEMNQMSEPGLLFMILLVGGMGWVIGRNKN